jgi:cephalosporin hydroxylase
MVASGCRLTHAAPHATTPTTLHYLQTQSVFLRQRWLGVAAMQSPFDFLAIGDIVHEVAPDVVLETGTANGGSALMWASLLELNGLTNSSVITVDLSQPGGADAFGADSAAPAQVVTATGQVVALPKRRAQTNPTQHELWRKYVTFVQGSSVEAGTVARIRALLHARQHQLQYGSGQQQQQQQTQAAGEAAGDAAAGSRVPSRVLSSMSASSGPAGDAAAARASAGGGRALRVLVVLDSHHTAAHVLAEMEAYCGLVSAGSFCIVQDTKLSRWTNADPGPLAAVRAFVGQHPEFRVQRDRELLFTHHPYGYLQRLY